MQQYTIVATSVAYKRGKPEEEEVGKNVLMEYQVNHELFTIADRGMNKGCKEKEGAKC